MSHNCQKYGPCFRLLPLAGLGGGTGLRGSLTIYVLRRRKR
jgi:hypothetical protein